MSKTGLAGKVVLVTGANHGIGEATARAFADEGAMVFIHYLCMGAEQLTNSVQSTETTSPGDALYRLKQATPPTGVVRAIRERGNRVEAWEGDLVDPAAIAHVFTYAEEILGPVDVLVNNAAICEPDTFRPLDQ